MHQPSAAEIVVLVAVTISAITDVRTKKIYNIITFPSAALGIAINAYTAWTGSNGNAMAALSAAGWSILYWFAAVIMIMGPRLRNEKTMHPGDAKLWGAIAACLQLKFFISFFFFAIAYGVISVVLIAKSIPRDQIKGFWLMVKAFFTAGIDLSGTVDTTEVDKARKALIPIGPAIAIGAYLGIFFEKPFLQFMLGH